MIRQKRGVFPLFRALISYQDNRFVHLVTAKHIINNYVRIVVFFSEYD